MFSDSCVFVHNTILDKGTFRATNFCGDLLYSKERFFFCECVLKTCRFSKSRRIAFFKTVASCFRAIERNSAMNRTSSRFSCFVQQYSTANEIGIEGCKTQLLFFSVVGGSYIWALNGRMVGFRQKSGRDFGEKNFCRVRWCRCKWKF